MSLQRILSAGPGFTDCTALGEGRTYYLAGASAGTGITIEAGTSTAAGPGAPVGFIPSNNTNGHGSIRLADDNSTFLRFSVTSGSLGSGKVWVAGPSDAGAVGKTLERTFEIDFSEFAALPAGQKTFPKTVILGSEIPAGAVVLAFVGDAATSIAFDDGSGPVTTLDAGDATSPTGFLNGTSIDVAPIAIASSIGDLTLHNFFLPVEDVVLVVTGANDLNGYTQGHFQMQLVLGVPVLF